MAVLWKSQTNYRKFDPQSWEDLREANSFPERFLPYEQLYRNLTREELLELLQDAKEQHWEVLDLRYCGLNVLPDMLGEMENLKVLSLGNHSASIAEQVTILANFQILLRICKTCNLWICVILKSAFCQLLLENWKA